MNATTHSRLLAAALLCSVCLLLSGCATTQAAVSSDTEFQPNEGVVTLRLVDLNDVHIGTLTVVSETTGEEFTLRAEKFGQTSSTTFVGRLPKGRYQPKVLRGATWEGASIVGRTIPIDKLTGKFDIEAGHITDLGSMVFTEIGGTRQNDPESRNKWTAKFVLPLDPTPVPVNALLAARIPQLAKADLGVSKLGWVPGTVPAQPAGIIDEARRWTKAVTKPVFIDETAQLAGGQLGAVAKHLPGSKPRFTWIDTVHAVESVLTLKDGRWLAGGEEGLLAVSADEGATWKRLSALSPEEVVIHLSQARDGRLFMVTDLDHEVVVYESVPSPIAWKVTRRMPSDRKQGILTQPIFAAANYLPDFAVASPDRLVIFTRPNTLNSLDLHTGKWESHETPRNFNQGIQLTPDGYLIGTFSAAWVYGSHDYGKTWDKLDTWANMTKPYFISKSRGILIAADVLDIHNFKVRFTEDGGKNWRTGVTVGSGWWNQPLWTNASGTVMFTVTPKREIVSSNDQGRTWQ